MKEIVFSGIAGRSPAAPQEFPVRCGEMAARIRDFDWSKTSLGPASEWPAHLKAAIRLILPAKAQIVLFWGPELVALYNDAYAATIGDKHPTALGRPARENWRELWDDLEPLLRRVIETGETVFAKDRPFYIERRGYPENVYFDISYSSVHDEAGGIGGVLCIVNETTERVDARQELMIAQERLSLALDAAGMGVFDWDVRTDRLYADAGFAIDPAKARDGAPIAQYLASIHPDDADRVRKGLERAIATGEKFIQQYRLLPKAGAARWVETRGERHFDGEGKPVRFVGVVMDITDQKEAQERQRLILQEMNHRVKNLLALFQGLINLSARSAQTPQEMAQSLSGRLEALMRAKDLVRPGLLGQKGAQSQRTTVGALVRTILQPYADGESADRIIADGPELPVGANAATSLALALHESATNATKYGALSEPNGAIRVEWRIAGDSLCLEWEETGGPAILAPPQAHGFGAVLVDRSIAGQLGGTIDYDWRAAGLKLTLVVPLARLDQ